MNSHQKKLDAYNDALYSDLIQREMKDFEPKRTHRYSVEFPELRPFVVQKIDKPKINGGKWGDMEMELLDPIGPSTSQIVFGLTNPKNYEIKFDKRSLFEKILRKPLFTFKVKGLDPTGHVVEEWTIAVKRIKSIDFGTYDYAMDGISKIHLVIVPQYCTLNY